jgi:hypothetical protein
MFITIPQHVTADGRVLSADPNLVQFTDHNTCTAGYPTRIGRFCSRKDSKQGALARTITTDNTDSFAFAHPEGNITQ